MMETKKKKTAYQRMAVTSAFYLAVILAALLLGVTHQVAGWVAQVTIALSLFRVVFLFGWGVAKNGRRWRV